MSKNYSGYIGLADWSSLYASYLNSINGSPHPSPILIAKLQDKLLSRKIQSKYVSTPLGFYAANNIKDMNDLRFPLFIKPRRASMSFCAKTVNSKQEVESILLEYSQKLSSINKRWVNLYDLINVNQSVRDGLNSFVVEPLLHHGSQLTLDGFVQDGKIRMFGFTKSVFEPNHISFKRFDYPLKLPFALDRKITKHAKKLLKKTGFNNSLFNIEYKYDISNKTFELIEINTRPSSQFMYSIACVKGIHPLDVAINIVSNVKVKYRDKKTKHISSSICVFRQDKDALVVKLPNDNELNWFFDKYPDGRWNAYAKEGEKLSKYPNDSHSFRYAEMIVTHPSSIPIYSFEDDLKQEFNKSINLKS